MRDRQAEGTAEYVVRKLTRLVDDTGADELMLVTPVHDPADRIRSFELVCGAGR
ncbi:MAG TPA: hypothetical protein VFH94_12205 [Streptomyces sp.]|nr:hypothetical protein [Streptomyces sp.]